jgi:hypothetical protein
VFLLNVVLEPAVEYGHSFLGRSLVRQWEDLPTTGAYVVDWLPLAGSGGNELWFVSYRYALCFRPCCG